jgi:3-isopropylmalate/(R)-2-methylmalate dehydratase small subunit
VPRRLPSADRAILHREGRAATDRGSITVGEETIAFEIDPVRRTKLLKGWDDIDMTMNYRDAIDAFAPADASLRPWMPPVRPGSARGR